MVHPKEKILGWEGKGKEEGFLTNSMADVQQYAWNWKIYSPGRSHPVRSAHHDSLRQVQDF